MVTTAPTGTEGVETRWTRGGIVGGILVALLGLVALFTPFLTGLALAVLVGGVLVVGGLIHVAAAFSAGSAMGVLWQVFLGIVYGAAGIAVLSNPVLGLTTLTLLVIAFFAVEGIVQIVWAIGGSAGNRLWLSVSGIVSLALAGLLWVGLPSSALWAVGVLFGVDLLSTGIAMILHGRGERDAATAEAAAQMGD